MKQELKLHLTPLLIIFIIISTYWIFQHTIWYQFVYLFFGLIWGSFILDFDHLVYWLYLNPNVEESRLAQIAFKRRDFGSLIKLLESTHLGHTNLIFHHYFAQFVLAVFSIFVFTSTDSVFAKGFVLAINVHLLVDEIKDFYQDRLHLQEWLFARESKQLPVRYLQYYILFYLLLTTILVSILTFSRP